MGYYIYHKKAALHPPADTSPINPNICLEESFEYFDVPFSFFEPFVQEVIVPTIHKQLYITKSDKHYTEHPRVKEISIMKWFREMNTYAEDLGSTQSIYFYENSKKRGFYVEDVYDAMLKSNHHFKNHYEVGNHYASFEAFLAAFNNIDFSFSTEFDKLSNTLVEVYKDQFKEMMLDNYEEGKSFLVYF